MGGDPLIRVRSLVKTFQGVRALDGVDFEVAQGEVVVVIGQSGSGKSTLIRCLNGLVEPDAGEIRLGGEAVDTHSQADWRRLRQRVGMVFQDYSLFPHLTVTRNITLAPVRTGRATQAEADALARQLLVRVRLPEKADAYPAELSGGQQQRVAIARALAMRPEAMLFDEPTSALDPELVGEVLEAIRGLARDGLTMIVVTHEMQFAREVGTRVVFMDGGRIVEDRPSADFFTAPRHERAREFLRRIHGAAPEPVSADGRPRA